MPTFNSLYNVSLIQKASMSGVVEDSTVKPYMLDVVLQACSLNLIKLKAATGAAVVTLLLNDVAVPGLADVAVTNTLSNHYPSQAVNLVAGDVFTLSYVSGDSTDLFFNVQLSGLQVGGA